MISDSDKIIYLLYPTVRRKYFQNSINISKTRWLSLNFFYTL